LTDADLAARRQAWQPRAAHYGSGALWRYAQTVGDAHLGAVTHPGGKHELRQYADV